MSKGAPQTPLDETGADESTHPGGKDPSDDPEHQKLVARWEEGFDVRWGARENSLVDRLSGVMTEAISAAQAPLLARIEAQEREISNLRGAVQTLGKTAERQAALLEQQGELLQRWADNSAALVTRLEQLTERVERRDHYCATRHGNGASLPPGG